MLIRQLIIGSITLSTAWHLKNVCAGNFCDTYFVKHRRDKFSEEGDQFSKEGGELSFAGYEWVSVISQVHSCDLFRGERGILPLNIKQRKVNFVLWAWKDIFLRCEVAVLVGGWIGWRKLGLGDHPGLRGHSITGRFDRQTAPLCGLLLYPLNS